MDNGAWAWFLILTPTAPWVLALYVMLGICALAIPIYLSHVAGGAIERRVRERLERRDARRDER